MRSMAKTGEPLMVAEAREAAQAVARQRSGNRAAMAAIAAHLVRHRPPVVMVSGRGSSGHALRYAKYLIETRVGVVVAAAAPSVATLYHSRLDLKGALFLAVSQSGRSPDLVIQAEAARAGGAFTVALVNDPASPLAAACAEIVPLQAGPETSVAATKSFIASCAAIADLVAAWHGDADLAAGLDRLPGRLQASADLDWRRAIDRLAEARSALVVARGPSFAIAEEAALKLKETSELQGEAFSAAELMHGPFALADRDLPVLLFDPEDVTRPSIAQAVASLRAAGVDPLIAGPDGNLPVLPADHPALDPLTMIESFYGMVARLALRRGLDPDRPRNLRKVTETR